jgi:hypothetical protein
MKKGENYMSKKVNLIKRVNLDKIRKALKSVDTATKPQLAELTGLSVVTVNSLINTLLDSGEVLPDMTLSSEAGRPAASFRYNSGFRMALVIYMHEYQGRDMAFYCVIDLLGDVVERVQHKLEDACLESFDTPIQKLLEEFPQIQAICFGIPGGEVNQRLVISDYEGLRGKSLSGYIEERFHLPVFVENDINGAVVGYCHQNAVRDDQCIVGVYFPDKYPPGAGIYLNGGLYKGRNGLAGEIKYLPLGIQWEAFDYNSAERQEIIIKSIQSFCCMYNPHRLVLYGEAVDAALQRLLEERCLSAAERLMLPEIVISKDFNRDFEAGIKQLALKIIEKE